MEQKQQQSIINKQLTRMKIITVLFIAICFASVSGLFTDDSTVVKLTTKNFKELVLKSDQFWLVQFYAPWCGHCKKSAPEFEKAAEILEGIINLGAVDATENQSLAGDYGVSSYPTIKLFGKDKKKPIDFSSSDRTFEKFVNYSLGKAKTEINNRLAEIKNGAKPDDQSEEL